MKFHLTLLALVLSTIAFCQDLEGRWVNSSFTGEENLAYEFLEGQVVKMYYAGEEMTTKNPVIYKLEKKEESYIIRMKFSYVSNGFNADVVGLIKFFGKNSLEMEFWDKKEMPKELEFTDESLVYNRE